LLTHEISPSVQPRASRSAHNAATTADPTPPCCNVGSVAIGPIQPRRLTEWQPKPSVAPCASRAANAVPSMTARSSSGTQ